MTTEAELACVYSALVLVDDDIAVTVSITTWIYHSAFLLFFDFVEKCVFKCCAYLNITIY